MHKKWTSFFCVPAALAFAVGCQTQTDPPESTTSSASAHDDAAAQQHDGDAHEDHSDADVAAAMATLSPEDRTTAEAQKFCAISTGSLLGSMGTPLRLEIKGEPVFLCCSGCKSRALKNPDETLAIVAKLKAGNRGNVK
jgi:hypothetical protein